MVCNPLKFQDYHLVPLFIHLEKREDNTRRMKKLLFKKKRGEWLIEFKIKQCTFHKSVDKNKIYLQILIQNPKQSLDCKYIDLYTIHLKHKSHFPKTNPCFLFVKMKCFFNTLFAAMVYW